MKDGSAADPASIGVAVLLANWTKQGGQDYAGAATDQLDYLYQKVPRSNEGAISHRTADVQLWCVRNLGPTFRFDQVSNLVPLNFQERFCVHGSAVHGLLWGDGPE